MPLEATLMIIDNSEYMRNGDYVPSRFDAQADAVNTVFQTKIDSNPENTVGLMSMAGKGPEVLITHSKDLGQILNVVHATSSKIGGTADIQTAISIAQLALKHRQNKNLRQRIMVFVGSPLEGQAANEAIMVRLAKKLKKNNVAVDFVAFGDAIESDSDRNVLKAFVDNVSSSDNSHLVTVPPGPHLLSDVLLTSPILAGDRGIPEGVMGDVPSTSGTPGANNFEFGVDPSLDPELAMALRISMEEDEARRAAAEAAAAAESTGAAAEAAPGLSAATTVEPSLATVAPAVSAVPAAAAAAAAPSSAALDAMDEEEAMLQQALALSEGRDVEMEVAEGNEEEMTEEEAIARAIEMSMKGDEEENQGK